MKRRHLIYLIGALTLLALLGGGIALAQDSKTESPTSAQGAAETLGTGFT